MDKRIIVPEPFRPLLEDRFGVIVEQSGRSSGKSTTNETVIVRDTYRGQAYNSVYCRGDKVDLRDIYNATVSTIEGMGLADHFKFCASPFEITNLITGAKIYFKGINGRTSDDVNACKSFTPQGKTLQNFVLDEANDVKCWNHVVAARSTFEKFLLPTAKTIFAYNPPPSRKHWANIEFNRMISHGDATLIHSSWEDIRALLKPTTVEQILRMKASDPVHYRYWYGGEIVSLEGRVIWSFDREKHTLSREELREKIRRNYFYQPSIVFYGVDSGVRRDGTAVVPWALFPDGYLILLDTMYIDIAEYRRVTGAQGLGTPDQAVMMRNWLDETFRPEMADIGIRLPDEEVWCFDSAPITQDLMLEWSKMTGKHCVPVTNKDIERDNQRLVSAFHSGMLRILDTPGNAVTVEDLENFSYNDENEIPEGQRDHTIDATKYATYEYYYDFL